MGFKKFIKKTTKNADKGMHKVGRKNIKKMSATVGGIVGEKIAGEKGKKIGKKTGRFVAEKTMNKIESKSHK